MMRSGFTPKCIELIKLDMAVPRVAHQKAGGRKPTMDHVTFYETVFEKLAEDSVSLRPLPRPQAGDWLSEHPESGQSFRSFANSSLRAIPHGPFNTVMLITLGAGLSSALQEKIRKYITVFYQVDCRVIAVPDVETPVKEGQIRSCVNACTHKRQLFARDAMSYVQKIATQSREVSRCCVAIIGITMEDLTKDETWNFVYGQASLSDGMGVFSIARFSPEFNGEPVDSAAEREQIILKRACKVVSHELGHIFGLKHCINFQCLMNGVNHVDELNLQLLYECPCCTKKLQSSFAWDLVRRYKEIIELMMSYNFSDEACFLKEHVFPAFLAYHSENSTTIPSSIGGKYIRGRV